MRITTEQLRVLIEGILKEDHYEVGTRVKLSTHPEHIGCVGSIVSANKTGWGERYDVNLDDGPTVTVEPGSLEKE